MLALRRDDGAMDGAGADLGASTQTMRDHLQEAVTGLGRQRLAGKHDGRQFIVGEADRFDMRGLPWRKRAQRIGCALCWKPLAPVRGGFFFVLPPASRQLAS
jgi:hypothetical protein